MDEPEGHLVVRREHRAEVAERDELTPHVMAEIGSPVAEVRGVRAQVCFADHLEEAGHPRLRLDPVLRASHVHDVAVAEIDQMPGRHPGTGDLVDRQAARGVAARGVQGDDRHVERQLGECFEHANLRRDDHQTLDRLGCEVVEALRNRHPVARRQARCDHGVPRVTCGTLDRGEAGRRAVVGRL